ncbi:geranylgeranylglyceryl phosphate synthase [Sulfolobus islandicus M.14.25]|uniref:Geranylgeranylglyceryl phosphate synthase n=2 Tax=Saccharolobus islandicus TaxID=43080 RepID=GGGPS_SACI4|nr:geranylgeranylglyceryl/heptaprenylglyceryl phosphate synthase [Sulfolobus islandicus]C3MY66.1 RecName: Full=Geranylgeranylglyceryl phosphate synthase; Short=GGGP synthase; Short=GGGPS; AltName: Full=(S)-3-O-geranylgeranylglyceryl phosphate synthase; AltName: Full=Phosphoglycerol geranylgeranyltransferase [Sulfolobus islandicus M.14.25]C4KIS5.1 RecName: Full=Geranylgeranylglyceryl phosphate synthase; Short=GGGP synthase; Short=GGGPS; AltName: Full=(S)-3-O-geranylgeranylglyceryl phosphate syntha
MKIRKKKMKLKGKVKKYLMDKLNDNEKLHFSLLDPFKINSSEELKYIAKNLYNVGTDAFLIGGTLGVSKDKLDFVISLLDDYEIPKIIFPSNINLLSEKADALLFLSLLNSDDIYYVIGAQIVAAPIIKMLQIEVIPTAYVIVGHGGTAAHIGKARVIPYDNFELATAYTLAAEYLGMDFVYLEAGSGAPEPIRPEMISFIKKASSIPLIIGGGIRSVEVALKLVEAGANIIVTGNIIERDVDKAIKIIRGIKNK